MLRGLDNSILTTIILINKNFFSMNISNLQCNVLLVLLLGPKNRFKYLFIYSMKFYLPMLHSFKFTKKHRKMASEITNITILRRYL